MFFCPPFSFPWVKVNTNGLAKGMRLVVGFFEIPQVIFLVVCPWVCGIILLSMRSFVMSSFMWSWLMHDWQTLWGWKWLFYCDILLCFWSFQTCWKNCISLLQHMVFHCFHTFREGNEIADKLANCELFLSSLV